MMTCELVEPSPNPVLDSNHHGAKVMGILNTLEEVAGAVVAVEGLKKVDPNASFLGEAAAAVAGYKGVEVIKEKLEEKKEGEAGSPDQPA